MDEYVPIWSSSSIKLSRLFNDNDNVNKQGYYATLSRLERWQKPWGSLRKESKGTARKAAWFVGISPSRDGVRAAHSAWLLPRAPRLLMESGAGAAPSSHDQKTPGGGVSVSPSRSESALLSMPVKGKAARSSIGFGLQGEWAPASFASPRLC